MTHPWVNCFLFIVSSALNCHNSQFKGSQEPQQNRVVNRRQGLLGSLLVSIIRLTLTEIAPKPTSPRLSL